MNFKWVLIFVFLIVGCSSNKAFFVSSIESLKTTEKMLIDAGHKVYSVDTINTRYETMYQINYR
jgi:uncharacterized protein YcfL